MQKVQQWFNHTFRPPSNQSRSTGGASSAEDSTTMSLLLKPPKRPADMEASDRIFLLCHPPLISTSELQVITIKIIVHADILILLM